MDPSRRNEEGSALRDLKPLTILNHVTKEHIPKTIGENPFFIPTKILIRWWDEPKDFATLDDMIPIFLRKRNIWSISILSSKFEFNPLISLDHI